jgi:hypothetical protein
MTTGCEIRPGEIKRRLMVAACVTQVMGEGPSLTVKYFDPPRTSQGFDRGDGALPDIRSQLMQTHKTIRISSLHFESDSHRPRKGIEVR